MLSNSIYNIISYYYLYVYKLSLSCSNIMTFSGVLRGGGVRGKAHMNWLSCCKLKVGQKCSELGIIDQQGVIDSNCCLKFLTLSNACPRTP